jgi:hypothetical protein
MFKKDVKIFRNEELVDEIYDCTLPFNTLSDYARFLGANALFEESYKDGKLMANLYWILAASKWVAVTSSQFDSFISDTPMLV